MGHTTRPQPPTARLFRPGLLRLSGKLYGTEDVHDMASRFLIHSPRTRTLRSAGGRLRPPLMEVTG